MNQYKAAIDIGTNTAHIIIATINQNHSLEIHFRQRFYIYLAQDGIEKISELAIKRLFDALNIFFIKIGEYPNCEVVVTATEAIRKASNGKAISDRIISEFGWRPEVISGELEAKYIHKSVSTAIDIRMGSYLTVDVGGGSVEFIHTINGNIESIRSLPLGIANLYNSFHKSEPLNEKDENTLLEYLSIELSFIKPMAQNGTMLIGSAGTFEVFSIKNEYSTFEKAEIVERSTLLRFYNSLRYLDLEERQKSSLIPSERAQYIVMAFILVKFIVDSLELDKFWVSHYALKEGVLLSL